MPEKFNNDKANFNQIELICIKIMIISYPIKDAIIFSTNFIVFWNNVHL